MPYISENRGTLGSHYYESIYTWRSSTPKLAPLSNKKLSKPGFATYLDFSNPLLKQYTRKKLVKSRRKRWTRKLASDGKHYYWVKAWKPYYFIKKVPVFYVGYEKRTLPHKVWCQKLYDYRARPHMYSKQEVKMATYIESKMKDICHRIRYPRDLKFINVIHKKQHVINHYKVSTTKVEGSTPVLPGLPYLTNYCPYPYVNKYDSCTLSQLAMGSTNALRVPRGPSGSTTYYDEYVDTLEFKSTRLENRAIADYFWETFQDDIANEHWPTLSSTDKRYNGIAPAIDAAELYREGLPTKNLKYRPGARLVDIASSEWLRFNFGVKPLLSATLALMRTESILDNAVRTWNKAAIDGTYLDGPSGRIYDTAEQLIDPYIRDTDFNSSQRNYYNNNYYNHTTNSSFAICEGHVKCLYKPNFVTSGAQIGLHMDAYTTSIPSIIHELTPFSWLYDYFTDAKTKHYERANRVLVSGEARFVFSHHHKVEHFTTTTIDNVVVNPATWRCRGTVMIYNTPFYQCFATQEYYTRWVVDYSAPPAHSGEARIEGTEFLRQNQLINIAAVANGMYNSLFR